MVLGISHISFYGATNSEKCGIEQIPETSYCLTDKTRNSLKPFLAKLVSMDIRCLFAELNKTRVIATLFPGNKQP